MSLLNATKLKTIRKGSRIRVLVVDDSVVIRRLVIHALEEDPMIEVVGSAPNGSVALAKIPQLNPDLITLDIEMPEMDGIEMLRQLRRNQAYRDIRVIMFSTLTARGASATLEALSTGADDYVSKASNEGSLDRSMANLRNELLPRIKQFFRFEESQQVISIEKAAHTIAVRSVPTAPKPVRTVPELLVIGVSTGGPNALGAIIPTFPADFPLPILIVQHMPPVFTRLLAERLNSTSKLKVEEAVDGALVEPGKVLVAPGNFHMRVKRGPLKSVIKLDQEAPENSCRPAVDVLFRSAEEGYGAAVMAVIMTGMGSDGMRGIEVVKAHGGYVIAQDEASSVVWGMPGAVVNAGLADVVVPLNDIVPTVLRGLSRESASYAFAAVRSNQAK